MRGRRLRTPVSDNERLTRIVFSSAEVNKLYNCCFALKLAGTWWYMSPPRARTFGDRIRLTFRLKRRRFTVMLRDFKNLRMTELPYYWNMFNE